MTHVRDTSLDAYQSIRHQLGEKQQQVLSVFSPVNTFTNMELAQYLGWSINRVTPRVYELREKGLLKEDEKRICSVTGRRVWSWRLT